MEGEFVTIEIYNRISSEVLYNSNTVLVFHLPHVHILGTHHRDKEIWEAFKHRGALHNVLRWCNYTERVVSGFAHQIQSE